MTQDGDRMQANSLVRCVCVMGGSWSHQFCEVYHYRAKQRTKDEWRICYLFHYKTKILFL